MAGYSLVFFKDMMVTVCKGNDKTCANEHLASKRGFLPFEVWIEAYWDE
ncbi:hypothetical protein [Candidatus Erwinia haradaeae]|nr:hypothetical protein [Candidatus Erwinia haradaeae]